MRKEWKWSNTKEGCRAVANGDVETGAGPGVHILEKSRNGLVVEPFGVDRSVLAGADERREWANRRARERTTVWVGE